MLVECSLLPKMVILAQYSLLIYGIACLKQVSLLL